MQKFNFIGTLIVLAILSYNEAQSAHEEPKTVAFHRPTLESYKGLREELFRYEESKTLGSDIILTERESRANEIIMKVKTKEYEEGLVTPRRFTASQSFFDVLDEIKRSDLFKHIKAMPKGAVLHSHDTALCTTKYLIKLTYRKDLWVCQTISDKNAKALRFSKTKPFATPENDCTWELLSKVRELYGADKVDARLRTQLSMYTKKKYADNNEAWVRFMSIFGLLDGLLLYAPVWSDYYYNALKEFRADGVQYLEFRSTLPILYDLKGTTYTALDTVRIYHETLTKFMSKYPDFIGSKLIYAPFRNVDDKTFEQYMKLCQEIKKNYPDFFAGFDLVGQEENGRPLKDFVPQLLALPENINFFFHAGETNWFGSSVDENLIDAVLLGAKRIGHGVAALKHPGVLQRLKQQNIAIEINPISNQVLQLVSDFRNHPCSLLFAENYPLVISSDDPSFWKATPLSHDFYIAFLGMASAHSDLRFLKKLVLNSIDYSSMSDDQKKEAKTKWQLKWDAFIFKVLKESPSNSAATNKIN